MADTAENKFVKSRLERVLRYARRLAYYGDDEEDQRQMKAHGPYHSLQNVALNLDGLRDAVREYDEVLKIVEEEEESEG